MTGAMLRHWVAKDWSLNRLPIALGILGGVLSLVLIAWPSESAFYLGSVLLITVLIGTGFTVIMLTVVQERTEQTLPFVMSMPLSAADYTVIKLVGNMVLFLLPWLVLSLGTIGVILLRPTIPDGLIPFAILLLVELLTGYVMVLGVALVSESLGWSIAAVVVGNLAVQGFMYYTARVPAIAATMQADRVAWSTPASAILATEILVIVLVLVVTWRVQLMKTDVL